MRRWHWFAIPVAIAVVALVVAGLRMGPGHPAPAGSNPRPFGGVSYFSAAEQRALHEATELLVRDCMRSRHQEYWPVPWAGDRVATTNPYLLLDVARARTDGYGITAAAHRQAGQATRNDELLATLPAAARQRWQDTLVGTRRENVTLADGASVSYPVDGCVFLAGERLYGAGWTRLSLEFQGRTNAVIQATERDADVVKATAAWADCMRAAGHRYTTLSAPRGDVTARLSATGARSAGAFELRVAIRDATCQHQVGLAETVAAAQQGAERARLTDDEDRAALDRLRVLRAHALTAAPKRLAADTDERGGHTG